MIATVLSNGVVKEVLGGEYKVPEPKVNPKVNSKTELFMHSLHSEICPDCRLHPGVYRFKVLSFDKIEVTCPHCVDGWIAVKCNFCVKGILPNGSNCTRCDKKRPGTYVYKPSKKFPEGKRCRYCNPPGSTTPGKMTKKVNFKFEPVKCRLCNGTGELEKIQNKIIFNPLFREADLGKVLDQIINTF